MNKLKIYNEFGINPTTNFTAAGLDFYIPNLYFDNPEDQDNIWKELGKSFKVDIETLKEIGDHLVSQVLGNSLGKISEEYVYKNVLNLVHLYCAYDTEFFIHPTGFNTKYDKKYYPEHIEIFIDEVLIIPCEDGKPFGLMLFNSDTLFFNSGIRVALPKDTAGVFLNKSGKGNAGFDVRAQVVDVDYAGLVHLSMSYTKDNRLSSKVFIGDKLVQMLILPIYQTDGVECLDRETYDKLMKDSLRGTDGFGSSDIKH